MGWHEQDMTPEIHADYYRVSMMSPQRTPLTDSWWIYISSMVYLCSLFGYKQTILLLYLRLFGVNRKFTYFTSATMFFVFGYLFSNFWTQLFGCCPPARFWNPNVPGRCFQFKTADITYSAMNIASDFFIMILPLPMIWNLQLWRKGKIGISLVFLSGAFACAVAIIRINYVLRDLFAVDRSWNAGKTFLWSVLEINTGLICSCTPSFKPFYSHLVSRPFFQRYVRRFSRFRPTASFRNQSLALTGRLVETSQESHA